MFVVTYMEIHKSEVQSIEYTCAFCGEINSTFVDPSQGDKQNYFEDCQVCCRPNELTVHYDEWVKSYRIRSERSQ